MLSFFFPELALESAQDHFDVLAMTFFHRRLLVGLWKVYKKATFDPHQVLCLNLEIVDLNMSATSPSQDQVSKRHWTVSSRPFI